MSQQKDEERKIEEKYGMKIENKKIEPSPSLYLSLYPFIFFQYSYKA